MSEPTPTKDDLQVWISEAHVDYCVDGVNKDYRKILYSIIESYFAQQKEEDKKDSDLRWAMPMLVKENMELKQRIKDLEPQPAPVPEEDSRDMVKSVNELFGILNEASRITGKDYDRSSVDKFRRYIISLILAEPKTVSRELVKKCIPCTCDIAYTSRNLEAPDCEYHNEHWRDLLEFLGITIEKEKKP